VSVGDSPPRIWVTHPMERGGRRGQHRGMARLLVAWRRPHHLSDEEARAWVRAESGRLLELPAVARLELTELDRASDAQSLPCDWLLDVHLAAGPDSARCVEEPLFADWLRDLHLLGMRPVVLLAERTIVLEPEEG
jgi:hypothetical protein